MTTVYRIEDYGGHYNLPGAGTNNSQALDEMVRQIGRDYVDGSHRQHCATLRFEGGGYLALRDTIPLPEATVANRKTIIPTTIDLAGCTVVVNADKPAIYRSRKHYPASKINALTSDNARLVVQNGFLSSGSRDAGVIIEDAGKDFVFRDVQVSALGDGFRIQDIAGGVLDNCYAFRCGRHGLRATAANVLRLSNFTARACGGDGMHITNSSDLSGSAYLESNDGYGIDALSMANSTLSLYQENNRRRSGHSGVTVRQGRMVNCRGNTISGRTGGMVGSGFHADQVSRQFSTFPETPAQTIPDRKFGWELMEIHEKNNWHKGFDGPQPELTITGKRVRVTIPRDCFDGVNGKPNIRWNPTNRHEATEGHFRDGAEVVVALDCEASDAAVQHFDMYGNDNPVSSVKPRLGVVWVSDGAETFSENWVINGRHNRMVIGGKFPQASKGISVIVLIDGGGPAGPKRELNFDCGFTFYDLSA